MKNTFKCYLALLCLFALNYVNGQAISIATEDAQAARESIIQALVGDGVTISNITFDCPAATFGAFQDGFPDLGQGMVMGTGEIDNLTGPNNSDNYPSPSTGPGTEADLSLIVSEPLRDVRVVEFDMMLIGDSVSFNYVFGSEEYPEFVCAEFNDVFGFFISGPGISGPFENNAVNLARIPGTEDPIAINSVNGGAVGEFGLPQYCSSLSNSAYYVDNENGLNHELDGTTVTLTAGIAVIPCETYHLKLAIADVTDSSYDSAVFLQEGSLQATTGQLGFSTGFVDPETGQETAIRDCLPAIIDLEFNTPVGEDFYCEISFGPGLAEGLDFEEVPDVLFFSEGLSVLNFPIEPIFNFAGNVAGEINLHIEVFGPNGCTLIPPADLVIPVIPSYDPEINIPSSVCEGDTLFLSAEGLPYYAWDSDGTAMIANEETGETYAIIEDSETFSFSALVGNCLYQASQAVTVLSSTPSEIEDHLCPGETVWIDGVEESLPGTYLIELQSSLGCDSIIELTLNTVQEYEADTLLEICEGDSVFVAGSYQSIAGFFQEDLETEFGCDSILRSTVTVLSAPFVEPDLMICAGDSLFLQGQWQFTNGIYFDTLTASNACDSIVMSSLIVAESYDLLFEENLCNGDSILVNGIYYKESIFIEDQFSSSQNCDSIVAFNIVVEDVILSEQVITICQGDSAFIAGAWESNAYVFEEWLLSSSGCDSLSRTQLIVTPSFTNLEQEVNICLGDSLLINGNWEQEEGDYLVIGQTTSGCDSSILLSLKLQSSFSEESDVQICQGESYFIEGAAQSTSGIYSETFSTTGGCDSTVIVDLEVVAMIINAKDTTICAGDTIYLADQVLSETGFYSHIINSSGGCDSLVEWTLNVQTNYFVEEVVQLCQGESYMIDGVLETEAGIYAESFESENYCDSTRQVELQFSSAYSLEVNLAICPGDSIFLENSWQFQEGVYFDSFGSSSACDSSIMTTLEIVDAGYNEVVKVLCPGETFEFAEQLITEEGFYCDTMYLGPNCEHTVCYQVEYAEEMDVDLPQSVTVLPGQEYEFDLNQEYFYYWEENDLLSCLDCSNPSIITFVDEWLSVSVRDSNDCSTTIEILLDVITDVEVKIPNAFSPNGDGINDYFKPLAFSGAKKVARFAVFNRWGQIVHESSGDSVDDIIPWYGQFDGNDCEMGVYVYSIELAQWDGTLEVIGGNVSLIR